MKEESLQEYLHRKMRETVSPNEMMNRVRLLFPNATLGEDVDGQTVINTGVKIIGEGLTERFIPLEGDNVGDAGTGGGGKPPKP
jgi:hypothetical protein